MNYERLVLTCTLSLTVAGCAGLYERQPPAPVYGRQPQVYGQPDTRAPVPAAPRQIITEPEPVVKTKPLKDYTPSLTPIQEAPVPRVTESSPAESTAPDVPVQSPGQGMPFSEPAPAMLSPFEPIETATPSSPAIGALVMAATQNSQAGNLDSAVASIERAIRIEPRNPALYYKLAILRIKQSKPRLAEDLAKKSALLAAQDNQLKKHSWLLIAHARELQGDFKGAKAARAKADSF